MKNRLIELMIYTVMIVETIVGMVFFIMGFIANVMVGGFRAGFETADQMHQWMSKEINRGWCYARNQPD